MFLRIDVYPGSLQQAAAAAAVVTRDSSSPGSLPPLSPPSATLHVYPALLKEDKTTLFTVGRKEPVDVLLSQDKSVSRLHCRFSLRGTFFAVENLSKSGCYVVRPIAPPSSRQGTGPSGRDDGSDSDATDDGVEYLNGPTTQSAGAVAVATSQTQPPGGVAGAALPLSRTAMQVLQSQGLDPALYQFETIAVDQTRTLTDLENDRSFVIVQCGKLDSTLVISRNDLVVPPKTKSLVEPSFLVSVGARLESDRFGPFTHYVAKKYSATATMLAAWCRGAEFVTPDYFDSLGERTGPADPMPELDDYRPGLSSEKDRYWLKRPPPSWRGWTFVAVPSSKRTSATEETVEWMRSTGAAVDETVEFASALEHVVTNAGERKAKLFTTSHKNWLTKAQLENAGVVVCDAKTLASRLTQFQSPDGSWLEEVTNAYGDDGSGAQVDFWLSTAPTANARASESEPDAPRHDEPPRIRAAAWRRSAAEEKRGRLQPNVEREEQRSVSKAASPKVASTAKETPELAAASAASSFAESEPNSKRPKRETRNERAHPAAQGAGRKRADSIEAEYPSPTTKAAENEAGGDDGGDGDAVRNDRDAAYMERMMRPRKFAKTTVDGWLEAASAAAAAGAGKKPRKGGGDARHPYSKSTVAVTSRVRKGFLLQVPLGQDRTAANRSSDARGGVDYRGFRKNVVYQAEDVAQIHLVSVAPKETEAAIHMEAQRRQLEERQRMADDLFRDPEFPGGRVRSRR